MSHSIILATNVDAAPARVFEILSTTEGQQALWTSDCEVASDRARFGFEGAPVDFITNETRRHFSDFEAVRQGLVFRQTLP